MRLKVVVWLLLHSSWCMAQQADSIWASQDTLTAVVRAYETNRSAASIAAAISVINRQDVERFTNTSLVSALNTAAGVRMEERSPGSYRLNLRGSSLRSPFGIRNVKVYLNEIPFTDPGGNTYLNQLDFHNISSLEIIKGPAGSLYGAGTGGAMLLHTMELPFEKKSELDILSGSYGLFGVHGSATFGNNAAQNNIRYAHQQSDGWRDHTNMRRDIVTYENTLRISNKQTLQTIAMYGDLYYQTPGALTLQQYIANPRAARPAAGPFPSAETAKAAVYQQTFLAGIANTYYINQNWKNTTAVYGAASWFKNPTFRLYEKRTEPHAGARTVFANDLKTGTSLFHVVYGGEIQKGIFSSRTFKNKNGSPDSIITDDEINNWRYSVFAQVEWLANHGWSLTAGVSYNNSYVGIDRLLSYPITTQERKFNSDFAPRFAVMKSFEQINIYGTISKGFSPPTTAELLPGTGIINTTLQSEEGINYEAGIKSAFLQNKLIIDLSLYHFYIDNAISQRRDSSGGDYYVNAGKTKQNGIELFAKYAFIQNGTGLVKALNISAAYTGNFYSYANYKVLEADYGGNRLPGIPKQNIVLASNAATRQGFYTNLTYQYTSRIALNDANSAYADPYHLLSARLGWQFRIKQQHRMNIFIAADNLLDKIYSLGNDINAAAGRYYNAAPGRYFSGGVSIAFRGRKSSDSSARL